MINKKFKHERKRAAERKLMKRLSPDEQTKHKTAIRRRVLKVEIADKKRSEERKKNK